MDLIEKDEKWMERTKLLIGADAVEILKKSHVLVAMGIPDIVQCGVIRISFSDQNQTYEVDTFIEKFKECVTKQLWHI